MNTVTKQVRSSSSLAWKQGVYALYGYVVRDENGREVWWSNGFRTAAERDADLAERGYAE
jgi:hypothetical protein